MDKSIIVMDESIILSSINGLGYKVNIDELVKIYYEFDESDSSEEYLEIILNNFEIVKDFVTQKCGGEFRDFDVIEYNDYLRSDKVFERIQTECNCIADICDMLEDIKDPNAHMFELIELGDGTLQLFNVRFEELEVVDNIVDCFCTYMEENWYV